MINFMYHGAADVPQDNINEFLKTAQSLDIKGLAEENHPPDKQVRASPIHYPAFLQLM